MTHKGLLPALSSKRGKSRQPVHHALPAPLLCTLFISNHSNAINWQTLHLVNFS